VDGNNVLTIAAVDIITSRLQTSFSLFCWHHSF
jgi:hypothetical protein